MNSIPTISKDELISLNGKYIFHGSHTLFDVCKPHLAKCESKRPENEHFAIYGSNNLTFALLFAFEKLPKNKLHWTAKHDASGNFYGVLKEGTYIAEDDFGYLYCFDPSYFTPTDNQGFQYICEKEIQPLKVFKVAYKDYNYLFFDENSHIVNNENKER